MTLKTKLITVGAIIIYSVILAFTVDLISRSQLGAEGVFFVGREKSFLTTNGLTTGCTAAYKLSGNDEPVLLEYIETESDSCPDVVNEVIISQSELEDKLLNYDNRLVETQGDNFSNTLINNNLLSE